MKWRAIYDETKGKKVYREPLAWWKEKEMVIPLLNQLTHRVLDVPATQAHTECLFLCAGNAVAEASQLV